VSTALARVVEAVAVAAELAADLVAVDLGCGSGQLTLKLAPMVAEVVGIEAFRVTRARAFGEANKRTALLLSRWLFDHNGEDGARIIDSNDREVADLLVRAAAGQDVQRDLTTLLRARKDSFSTT
jgi:methylase of polypeptide subunit release factors